MCNHLLVYIDKFITVLYNRSERGDIMNPVEVKKKLEERYDKQNDFNRNNYDRVSVMFPKGYRDEVKQKAKEQGKSLNSFIIEAVQDKMKIIE